MRKVRLRQSGFSLVELMVVVAIIGILAAIAVPNFQKFTAKSKQSEAKSNLSALYSTERAFQAEWQMYTSAFEATGYAPVGLLRYEHGFGAGYPGTGKYPSGFTEPTKLSDNSKAFCVSVTPNPCSVNQVPVAPGSFTQSPAASNTGFLAEARGDIDGDATIDVWTITDLKTLTNNISDVEK